MSSLVCPETRLPLRQCDLEQAKSDVAGGAPLVARRDTQRPPIGATETVLVRQDGGCAYPVVDDIPILLVPERLVPPREAFSVDLSDPRYAEAYEEMDHYDSVAEDAASSVEHSPSLRALTHPLELSREQRRLFPEPAAAWLDATYDCAAQWDSYRHLAPMEGKRVLQIGGKGLHAVKFLLAGAAEAWAISPMLGEMRHARALAQHLGLDRALHCVVAVAEELPLSSSSVEAIYSGGTFHHLVTEMAAAECARVLSPGGKLAAVEPWRAPLYAIGTKLFGKREHAACQPMDPERLHHIFGTFPDAQVVPHGALTRYPLLGLQKLGLEVQVATARRITKLDDALSSLIPPLRRSGSSIAILAARDQTAIPGSSSSAPSDLLSQLGVALGTDRRTETHGG